jgi:hypothetical protein
MTLELNEQELDIVMRALMQQPYMAVAQVIPKIVQQANAQKPAAPAVPAPAAE